MATTHKLSTLRDVYEKVPADKLALCMREIAEAMEHAKDLTELLDATVVALHPGTSAATIWPDVCEWIDDGNGNKTISVTDAATGDVMFTLDVRSSA